MIVVEGAKVDLSARHSLHGILNVTDYVHNFNLNLSSFDREVLLYMQLFITYITVVFYIGEILREACLSNFSAVLGLSIVSGTVWVTNI